jgi:hypothetical protein
MLWKPEVRYGVHNNPPLVITWSQFNPVHTIPCKVVPVFSEAPRHEDLWASGCIDSRLLDSASVGDGHLHALAALAMEKEECRLLGCYAV